VRLDFLKHRRPGFTVVQGVRLGAVAFQIHPALRLFLIVVAVKAVRLKHRTYITSEIQGRRMGDGVDEQKATEPDHVCAENLAQSAGIVGGRK